MAQHAEDGGPPRFQARRGYLPAQELEPAAVDGIEVGVEQGQLGEHLLVLPLLGPSSLRHATGLAVDSFGAPGRYFLDAPIVLGARALQVVNLRARYLELIEENRMKAFDYYTFVRDAFLDLRANQIRDGELEEASEADEDLYFLEEP